MPKIAELPKICRRWLNLGHDELNERESGGHARCHDPIRNDVKMYTDWRPEIMSMYKRLAHEAPK
jgi:hypothetical protein